MTCRRSYAFRPAARGIAGGPRSSFPVDPALGPGLADGLGLVRAGAEALARGAMRDPRERRERARGGEQRAAQRVVPDASRRLPRVAAEARGEQVEGVVRDARVDVDAAVVVDGVDVVLEVGGLRVLAEPGIVVGGAGRLHRAQRVAVEVLAADVGADQPVRLAGG